MRIQSTVGGAALALAAAALAAQSPPATPHPGTGRVTFARDIRPILQAHCTICHSRGGPSPMPLVTSEDALPWAEKIKESALSRRMPIWHAARGYGAFSNDPTLNPYELALIVTWADGNSALPAPPAPAPSAPAARPARSAPHAADVLTFRPHNGWATGWTFAPGDPLITSATFTSGDGAAIGTWTAGDRAVRLPRGSAMRVVSPVRVEIRRREKTSYETAVPPRPSTLRFTWFAAGAGKARRSPSRRVRIERVACGGTLGPSEASIIGVRPLLPSGAGVQVSVERIGGAQPALLGWFRDVDPAYARIYWLARPIDFAAGARITGDAPCELDVFLSARR